uniref:Uncharacterized protein n=1 Tax=Lepeophtheirus salmonis TaxID=72036 RepID=A0A0K2TUB5_LEPSM
MMYYQQCLRLFFTSLENLSLSLSGIGILNHSSDPLQKTKKLDFFWKTLSACCFVICTTE